MEKQTGAENAHMKDIAVKVDNLCIEYRPLRNISIVKNLFHKTEEKEKIFQAVKGVSFEVEKGEILGIVGKNGSGKSTMLRAIAGIFRPDRGFIDLYGNSVSLLSIGVGFNDEMSGRKNIISSGMLLGFTKQQILDKMDFIINFAEIGEYIDLPVKTYSSGMHSKLAFSITANLETDIMLIDEVLSVGDERFKKKSLNKMKELISNADRTVMIVSHDLKILGEMCHRIMWVHEGEIKDIGMPDFIISEYSEFMNC